MRLRCAHVGLSCGQCLQCGASVPVRVLFVDRSVPARCPAPKSWPPILGKYGVLHFSGVRNAMLPAGKSGRAQIRPGLLRGRYPLGYVGLYIAQSFGPQLTFISIKTNLNCMSDVCGCVALLLLPVLELLQAAVAGHPSRCATLPDIDDNQMQWH